MAKLYLFVFFSLCFAYNSFGQRERVYFRAKLTGLAVFDQNKNLVNPNHFKPVLEFRLLSNDGVVFGGSVVADQNGVYEFFHFVNDWDVAVFSVSPQFHEGASIPLGCEASGHYTISAIVDIQACNGSVFPLNKISTNVVGDKAGDRITADYFIELPITVGNDPSECNWGF